MKCSENWLREWVNIKLNLPDLCNKLTMSGLEVEEVLTIHPDFKGVVIGEIKAVRKLSDSDHLHICDVSIGSEKLLKIVCGAQNVRQGLKVPVAMINAELPNGIKIKLTEIRDVVSEGMLCSAKELGLQDQAQGLLELPKNSPVGEDLSFFLNLNDVVINISVTPNRGDCLSIKGVAREISSLTNTSFTNPNIAILQPTISDRLPIKVSATEACPHYVGRVIKNLDVTAETPIWMQERLRRAGVRHINPVVDVTNYVMLELGQPMHAFDLDKIVGFIDVRYSKENETIDLLDGSHVSLNSSTLVISDEQKAIAVAGVMGGLDSGVTSITTNIFLESAFFDASAVAESRQTLKLNSDSAYRFERGIDSAIQREAMERATELILLIAGGQAGPILEEKSFNDTTSTFIKLSNEKLSTILGINIASEQVERIFDALYFEWHKTEAGWQVKSPSYRPDLVLPEDLIEEIARVYGYNEIPATLIKAPLTSHKFDINFFLINTFRNYLKAQDYHEIISYSFVDETLQHLFDEESEVVYLMNPISSEMNVMRTSLWPGLVNTFLYNSSRQQHRVRIFENGLCFKKINGQLFEAQYVGGLVSGNAYQAQWGVSNRDIDFYDVKSHLNNILRLIFKVDSFEWLRGKHKALHPGQSADVFIQNKKIATVGAIHPNLLQKLGISEKFYLFEICVDELPQSTQVQFKEWSKFPEIRRDIAILIKETIPAAKIQDTIKNVAGAWLKDIFIFDVYQGKGIAPDLKSVALGLILQHPTRTLVDDEVAKLMDQVIAALKEQLGAQLRS